METAEEIILDTGTNDEAKDLPKRYRSGAAQKLLALLKGAEESRGVFWANEITANLLSQLVMTLLAIVIAVCWVFTVTDVFQLNRIIATLCFLPSLVLLIGGIGLLYHFKGSRHWLKNMAMAVLCVVISLICCVMGFRAQLALCIPVVLSTRYLSGRFTEFTAILAGFLLAASSVVYCLVGITPDMNVIDLPVGTMVTVSGALDTAITADMLDKPLYILNMLRYSVLPNLMIFLVISIICCEVARLGSRNIREQSRISAEHARVETELSLANDIQAHMLPCTFPPFPERDEFDVYAEMHTAKEVGGDFYDFFMVDQKRFGFVIADVSGKGVPAALFMVITRTLIKNHAQLGMSPAEVFRRVSNMLCEGNEANLFVTAWMGYLDTETGLVTYVNAGHNPPLVKEAGGEFRYLKAPAGLVLAGIEDFDYQEQTIRLQPGDRLFLYTDGVTEAQTAGGAFYGEKRLQQYLNAQAGEPLKNLLDGLQQDIADFCGDVPQFDDITMMLVDVKNPHPSEVKPA